MKNGMSTYFERLQNPGREIIDFSYLYSHPECIYIVFETYKRDFTFQSSVNQKIKYDLVFKKNFLKVFKRYLENNITLKEKIK